MSLSEKFDESIRRKFFFDLKSLIASLSKPCAIITSKKILFNSIAISFLI